MVETVGIEPMTSTLPVWRSPSWATPPYVRKPLIQLRFGMLFIFNCQMRCEVGYLLAGAPSWATPPYLRIPLILLRFGMLFIFNCSMRFGVVYLSACSPSWAIPPYGLFAAQDRFCESYYSIPFSFVQGLFSKIFRLSKSGRVCFGAQRRERAHALSLV